MIDEKLAYKLTLKNEFVLFTKLIVKYAAEINVLIFYRKHQKFFVYLCNPMVIFLLISCFQNFQNRRYEFGHYECYNICVLFQEIFADAWLQHVIRRTTKRENGCFVSLKQMYFASLKNSLNSMQ